MNKTEYEASKANRSTYEYRYVHDLCDKWKSDNNLTCKCVVHHRDDTDETRDYNSNHYELWGFNEDGSFEYGKYVVFMTQSEHSAHHSRGIPKSEKHKQSLSRTRIENKTAAGENNGMYGKGYLLVGEKNGMYGKHHSDETRDKISKALQGKSNPLITGDKNGMCHITPEANARRKDKISDAIHKQMTALKFMYHHYKINGGQLSWNSFRRAIKTGDITFA